MRSVMIFNREHLSNQYLKRSLASVQQNRVLSRLHFAERSYVNTIMAFIVNSFTKAS